MKAFEYQHKKYCLLEKLLDSVHFILNYSQICNSMLKKCVVIVYESELLVFHRFDKWKDFDSKQLNFTDGRNTSVC